MSGISRKEFLAAAGAGFTLSALGAHSDTGGRVRHAVIGTGGQGQKHVSVFASLPGCEVVAVSDVDPRRMEKAIESASPGAKAFSDFRRLLDDPSIDSVSVTTPDHWHTPIAMMALQAGKHVYVEKPCTHNVREGAALAAAAAKYGKCVQHGTQSRSTPSIQQGIRWLREGRIGKVRLAKAINHQLRKPIGRTPESDPPEGVDYDLWLGPAPKRAFTQNRWHYNWHWFWEYGGGDFVNDGIHQVDVARWGLGVGVPEAVSASGGQLFYDDDHETPDTQLVTFEYPECYLVYEMRLWTNYTLEGHDNGVMFYGDDGVVSIGRKGSELRTLAGEREHAEGGPNLQANMENFIACVIANDRAALNAPIAEGIASAALCHLGNVATRVGRRLQIGAEGQECVGDGEANQLLGRSYRQGYELPAV